MRDVGKAIKQYKSRFEGKVGNAPGCFYGSDLEQILHLDEDHVSQVLDAMRFGFMVGYRLRSREERARRKS